MTQTPVINTNPMCDLCPDGHKTPAVYDARMLNGTWGFLCQVHYEAYGVGLGEGKGQILDPKNTPEGVQYTRCPNCGVRIPKIILKTHRLKKHGVENDC